MIALILTLLAVTSVRAAATVASPRPPLVTIVPVAELAIWAVVVLVLLAAAGWLATRRIGAAGRTRRVEPKRLTGPGGELSRGVAR